MSPTRLQLRSENRGKVRETIGCSEEGRPIEVEWCGSETGTLRALIIAGQHGDEPLAREATRLFRDQLLQNKASGGFIPSGDEAHGSLKHKPGSRSSPLTKSVQSDSPQVAIIENANPDGAFADTRKNARERDLNRDHQLLQSAEAQALHRFVRRWKPHLIIDVHTFAPRRKKLLAHDLVYYQHVLLDVANNPAIAHPMRGERSEQLLQDVITHLNEQGHPSARYVVLGPLKTLRHSNADVLDARNGLSLRHDTFTVLLEGRQWKTRRGETRTVHGLSSAIHEVIRWAAQHPKLFLNVRTAHVGDLVPLRNRYETNELSTWMTFLDASEQTLREIELRDNFTPRVVPTREVRLPRAYAVPRKFTAWLECLREHGFATCDSQESDLRGEQYEIRKLIGSTIKNRAAREITVERHAVSISASDFVLFPVEQRGGAALALFLEPESKYGLFRHAFCAIPFAEGTHYPVVRVN